MTQRNTPERAKMLKLRRMKQLAMTAGYIPVPAAKRTPQGKMIANKSHMWLSDGRCMHATKGRRPNFDKAV